jgi:hypothetical protein
MRLDERARKKWVAVNEPGEPNFNVRVSACVHPYKSPKARRNDGEKKETEHSGGWPCRRPAFRLDERSVAVAPAAAAFAADHRHDVDDDDDHGAGVLERRWDNKNQRTGAGMST